MKENSDLQSRVFSLEQEILRLRGDVTEKNASISVIRETESRVDSLEHNLSRIEDAKQLLPQIENKVETLKRNQKEKLEILKYGAQLMNDQINKLSTLFNSNGLASFGDPFASTHQSIFLSTIGEERPMTFTSLLQSTKNEEIKQILEKMNIGKSLKGVLENLIKFIYSLVYENVYTKTNKKVILR